MYQFLKMFIFFYSKNTFFYSKNRFEKLVHLISFIIRISVSS